MDELNEIGDFPFDPRDFAPEWFPPRAGLEAVEWLLAQRYQPKARSRLTEAVCTELAALKHVLEGAARSGARFHLVELEEDEDPGFAGPPLPVRAREVT